MGRGVRIVNDVNFSILNQQVQDYINANLNVDLHSFLLKKSPFPDVSILELAQQIQGKKIAVKKFPFLDQNGIIFPPHLNLEQSSSEFTARYKATLVNGKIFADLTAGFGIDAYFISENFNEVTLNDHDELLLEVVKHNWSILQQNAKFNSSKIEDYLVREISVFDVIYFDPARRDSAKKKVFLLEDLSPNILEIQDQLLQRSSQILIKLSPLIDLHYLSSVLKNLAEIHIVALKNEVKEVLVLLKNEWVNLPRIFCVNLDSNDPVFDFELGEEKIEATYSQVQDFLYVPNSAILKSGAFNLISQRFGLNKLHPNTHLYTSNTYQDNFPGRVLNVVKTNSKELIKGHQYNIISKNYPLKPDEIKQKYKLRDGGNDYLIATQDMKGKLLLRSTNQK